MAYRRTRIHLEAVHVEVDRFTDMNVAWLARVVGLDEPDADEPARRRRALAIFAAVEGAQLVARGRRDIGVFDDVIAAYRRSGLIT